MRTGECRLELLMIAPRGVTQRVAERGHRRVDTGCVAACE